MEKIIHKIMSHKSMLNFRIFEKFRKIDRSLSGENAEKMIPLILIYR